MEDKLVNGPYKYKQNYTLSTLELWFEKVGNGTLTKNSYKHHQDI